MTDSQWTARKLERHWNHWSQSVRLVASEWDWSGIVLNPSNGKIRTKYRHTINILTK